MQDLSIRGAGNILGAAQSGFIDSVGYELYSQLLEQAILENKVRQPNVRRVIPRSIYRLMPIYQVIILVISDKKLKFTSV